jgi:hypothetical protein
MRSTLQNERGFVLVTALWILLLLVFLGVSVISKSNTELLIAGNEKFDQTTFYQADGGVLGLGVQLLEENIVCTTGFATDTINGIIYVPNQDFWFNPPPDDTRAGPDNFDFHFPLDPNAPEVTYVRVGGDVAMAEGAGLQQGAGYMGKGKGMAGGGSFYLFDLYVTQQGISGTESQIWTRWRHMVGQEGTCNY